MSKYLDLWLINVYSQICVENGEMKNFITIRNTNDYIKLSHELTGGWKNFAILENFAKETNLRIDE